MNAEYTVNVISADGEIIGRVKPTTNLDRWDGHNWCRGVGDHLGITQLKSGKYVLVHTSQWIGSQDYAEIITAARAVQECLLGNNSDFIFQHPDLAAIYDQLDFD